MTTEETNSTIEALAQWSHEVRAASFRLFAKVAGDRVVDLNAALGRRVVDTVRIVDWLAGLFERGEPEPEQWNVLTNFQKVVDGFSNSHERTAVAFKLLGDALDQHPSLDDETSRSAAAAAITRALTSLMLPQLGLLYERQAEIAALLERFGKAKRLGGFAGSRVGLLAAISKLADSPFGSDASAIDKAIKRQRSGNL